MGLELIFASSFVVVGEYAEGGMRARLARCLGDTAWRAAGGRLTCARQPYRASQQGL